MILHLFDGVQGPLGPDRKHGELGYDHTGRVEVDYFYQVEQWLIEMPSFDPTVIRGELHADGKIVARWRKNDAGRFERDDG